MSSKPKQCSNPGCTKTGTHKCASCSNACYCSRECQVGHWDTHKNQCKASRSPKSGGSSPTGGMAVPTFASLTIKQLKHVIRSKCNDYEDEERKAIIKDMNNMVEKEPLQALAEKHVKSTELLKLLSTLPDKAGSANQSVMIGSTGGGSSRRGGMRQQYQQQEVDVSKASPKQLREQAAFLRRNPDMVRKTQPAMAHMSNQEILEAAQQLEELANNPNMMKEFQESWGAMTDEQKEMMKNITPEQREQLKNLTPEQKEQLKNITPEQKKEMMKMAHMPDKQRKNLQVFQDGLQNGIDEKWITAVTALLKKNPEIFKTMGKSMFPDLSDEQVDPYLDFIKGLDEYYIRLMLSVIMYMQWASKPVMKFYNDVDAWTYGNAKHIAMALAAIVMYFMAIVSFYVMRFLWTNVSFIVSFWWAAFTNKGVNGGGISNPAGDAATGDVHSDAMPTKDEFEF